ncbi:hypothetical protein SLA2020_017630 [Shorea laevis]
MADEDDMAKVDDVEHEYGKQQEEVWMESHNVEATTRRKKFEFEDDFDRVMSADGSKIQTNEYIDTSIRKSQKFPISKLGKMTKEVGYVPDILSRHLMQSQGQNSNCEIGDMNGPKKPNQIKEQVWVKGCGLNSETCLRDDVDWASNMGPNKVNKSLEAGNDVEIREMEIDKAKEVELNQRSRGCKMVEEGEGIQRSMGSLVSKEDEVDWRCRVSMMPEKEEGNRSSRGCLLSVEDEENRNSRGNWLVEMDELNRRSRGCMMAEEGEGIRRMGSLMSKEVDRSCRFSLMPKEEEGSRSSRDSSMSVEDEENQKFKSSLLAEEDELNRRSRGSMLAEKGEGMRRCMGSLMFEEDEVDRSCRVSLMPEEEGNRKSKGSVLHEEGEVDEVNQRSMGRSSQLEDLSEEKSFWQGFESESGKLKRWMGREERKRKKQRKKRLRSCSFVYKNSSKVVQQRKGEK